MVDAPVAARWSRPSWKFDPRLLALAFGCVFAWSEVTQAWRDWGLPGLVFTYTGFIPLQLAAAWSLWRASHRADLPMRARRALLALMGVFLCYAVGS
ncbi:MAG TPA: hypothetical protein VMJ30_10360, partial [Gemmatimonadales bacterium]|nr:hypothetical protein [Gemmatimonadales bacterium]